MPDFPDKKITISNQGVELAAMELNLGDHGEALGGSVICRDQSGNVAVALTGEAGQVSALAGGTILIRNGLLRLVNSKGADRVRIHVGDPLKKEDSGTIVLGAATDLPQASVGDHEAIVLSASKRSLVINGPDGKPMVVLGPRGELILGGSVDGEIILRDKSGKTRVNLGADARLTLRAPDEKRVASIGPHGDLLLGGGNEDGVISLRDKSEKTRVRLEPQRLRFFDSDGHQLANLGAGNGSLFLDGEIAIKGNLKRQRITERSRQVDRNQNFNLFRLDQNGAFTIELAASYSQNVGGGNFRLGTYYAIWSVFTQEIAEGGKGVALMNLALNQGTSSPPQGFWRSDMEPAFFPVDGIGRFAVGEVSAPDGKVGLFLSNATLCVRALYGTLLDF